MQCGGTLIKLRGFLNNSNGWLFFFFNQISFLGYKDKIVFRITSRWAHSSLLYLRSSRHMELFLLLKPLWIPGCCNSSNIGLFPSVKLCRRTYYIKTLCARATRKNNHNHIPKLDNFDIEAGWAVRTRVLSWASLTEHHYNVSLKESPVWLLPSLGAISRNIVDPWFRLNLIYSPWQRVY